MKKRTGMRALSALFAILLVSMGVVPAMAAQSDDETLANRLNIQSPNFKSTDKFTDSKVIPIDD